MLVTVVRICAKSQHFTAMTHSQEGHQPTTILLLYPFILDTYNDWEHFEECLEAAQVKDL